MLIDDTREKLRTMMDISGLYDNPIYQEVIGGFWRCINERDIVCIDALDLVPYINELIAKDPGEDFDEVVLNTCFDLRMPSNNTWVEWIEKRARFGVMIEFMPIAEGESEEVAELFEMNSLLGTPFEKMAFFIAVRQVESHDKGVFPLPWFLYFCLDIEGRIINGNETFKCIQTDPDFLLRMRPQCQDKQSALQIASGHASALLAFALITCSLLNVKNVVKVEHKPDQKLQARRKKRGQLPLVKYYTLEITAPGKRIIGATPTGTSETSSRPLHLVRGHLADYRDGKGLFGKYKGVYWIPSHMRGDIDNGVIKKRYRVTTDKD